MDKYGFSIFDSTYVPIVIPTVLVGGNAQSPSSGYVLSGGTAGSVGSVVYNSLFMYNTALPRAGNQIVNGPPISAQLTQNDGFYYYPEVSGATGIVYFGVTGPNQFAVGSSVSGLGGGSGDPDSFTGTVLSSSSSGLVVQITDSTKNQDPPNTTLPWTFSGEYYDQPNNGHTGTVSILNSSGATVSSALSYPLGSLSGITLTTPVISGLTGYKMSFYDSTNNTTRQSSIPIVWSPPPSQSLTGEKFIGTTSVISPSSFSLTNFDYKLNDQSLIYGPTGYTIGTLNVYRDTTRSNLLYTTAVTGGTGNIYRFDLSEPIKYYSSTTGATYTIIEYTSEPNNFFGIDYKYLMSGATITVYSGESGPTFFGGWTGPSYQGLSMGSSGPAALGFDYMYEGNASKSIIYQLIAQVDEPIPTSQIIDVFIPKEEMSRMLVYQSAWGILDPATGQTLQGFIGGGAYGSTAGTTYDPGTGFNAQGIYYGPTGLSGPNVALLLGSVLTNVNMRDGGITMTPYNVLENLDERFTTINGTSFQDDSNKNIQSIFATWSGMTFGGSTAPSLLTLIPAETISSISNSGLSITTLQSLLTDIDTITTPTGRYVPALSNLFAEAAAYGRADGADIITISQVGTGGTTFAFFGPSGPSGHTGPPGGSSSIAYQWNETGINTYGVNFQDGDSVTLYITYNFSRGRVFTLDPHVVTDLQTGYGFSVGNVASLVIGGKTIKLQQLNPDGSVNLNEATPDSAAGTNTRVYGIKLIAKNSDNANVTRFSS